MRVFRATTAAALSEISGVVHDAWFEPDAVVHDAERATVVVPFRQELWGEDARMDFVRRTWRYTEYRVPFMHGTLTIGHVEGVRAEDGSGDVGMLYGVDYDKATREIAVCSIGRMRFGSAAFDVEAVIGDEVAGHVRRRIGRFLGSGSDVPTWCRGWRSAPAPASGRGGSAAAAAAAW